MPDKTSAPKPKYKVEEVVDDETPISEIKSKPEEITSTATAEPEKPVEAKPEVPEPVKTEEPVKEETPAPQPETTTELPKVTSFSLVDHPKEEETSEPVEEKKEEVVAEAPESQTPPAPGAADSDVSSNEIQEWLQSVRPDTTQAPVKSGGGLGKVLAIFLTILIIAALGGGVYYYRANVQGNDQVAQTNDEEATQPETQTTPAAETPTPTQASADLSKLKVQILNGSGVAGEAGKAQSYLEKPGFKEFTTGNASSFNFTDTTVAVKANTPESAFTEAQKALSDYYQNVVKADKALEDSSQYDLVVTIGKKK